jgi:hypothetical protein
MLIVVIFPLAFATIVGGIAIIRSVKSNTEVSSLGINLSAGVGLALVGVGFLLAYFAILLCEF